MEAITKPNRFRVLAAIALAASLLVSLAGTAWAATLTFAPAQKFGVGNQPSRVTSADFDSDGKADLAVMYSSSGGSVFLSNGDGTFQPAQNFGAGGGGPFGAITSGDFDGDNEADLAVNNLANGPSSEVSVLLGNGDGTFQPAQNFDTGILPIFLASADFDGDGRADLAVSGTAPAGPAGPAGGRVLILLGSDDGTFQQAQNFGTGGNGSTNTVISADFDGDEKPDLAVRNDSSNEVSVFLGNGDGTFQQAQNLGVGGSPGAVVGEDFDGDGKADLAVTYASFGGGGSVFLSNGDGTFQQAQNFAAPGGPVMTSADFDGDKNRTSWHLWESSAGFRSFWATAMAPSSRPRASRAGASSPTPLSVRTSTVTKNRTSR